MTQKEILECNKLIACFEGWEHGGKGGNLSNFYYKDNKNQKIHSNDFKYHSSWDALLPVYKKLYDDLQAYKSKLNKSRKPNVNKYAIIGQIDNCDASIRCAIWAVSIERAHYGISETIKQYNNNFKWITELHESLLKNVKNAGKRNT